MRHQFKKNKYNASRTEYKGIKYDSKLEASYAEFLDRGKEVGRVLDWTRQVPFYLPGGITYRVDFLVFTTAGKVEFVEVKGRELAPWKMKMRLMKQFHPDIPITIVRKVPTQ